ncbi:mediator of RNA polymerase II transcription subunit 14-like [Musa acuminata AAA Group]|uniref:mediator of RNA polymerase II transcription subunit 14-like n=1 Tax=Musa acuminata AAA Group TaxID=214697 RepID=UPI0031DB5308
MAAELGQQTVEFSALVRRAAEDSYLALKELVERSRAPEDQRSDSEKKIDLLKFIAKTRQRMLRLHVLAKWCRQVPLIQYCQQLAATLSSHDTCFTQTADSLFYMHEGLQHARAPIFDVPSAIEILLSGGYKRLPKCIEDLVIQSTLPEDEQKPTLKKLDTILRSKLLEVVLPKEISEVTISDGIAVLRVDGEFKVFLTLGYRGHLSLWRILHIELLVGEKSGTIKLEETRRYALGDDLERRMAATENPFLILYTVLHELCVALVMDTVLRQVQVLRQCRWKDAIRFELISDGTAAQGANTSALQLAQDGELDSTGLKTPGLKIIYWLDADKNAGGSDFSSRPFLKLEPGKDTQIKCLHNSFVLDPLTGKEAIFSLDQSCIDLEKLLLKAIACNIHTRLFEIQRELSKSVNICRGTCDVVLKNDGSMVADLRKKDENSSIEDYFGDEVLKVRACGMSFITLGINIRECQNQSKWFLKV